MFSYHLIFFEFILHDTSLIIMSFLLIIFDIFLTFIIQD